jgi:predicted ATPase/DNA-binding CsgD family transcriptional regulator
LAFQVYNLLGCLGDSSRRVSAWFSDRVVILAGKRVRVSAVKRGFAMANFPYDLPNPLPEALTHREHEILARLAGDLYGREIAEALMLSPNSVKWYIHQIYAKLGVSSRKEAIRRARELGLLEYKTPAALHFSNLPLALTPFVGRQAELEQVCQLLSDPEFRLLTLTGAGGVGKSRLALRAAGELQGSYSQGACLVELASLSEPELLPQTLAAAFNLRLERDRPFLTALMDYLRNRDMLMVLDNCEHLVATCASLVNSLLQACPDLHILATSREALGIPAERTYHVPSMSFPEPGQSIILEELIKYEAVDLFNRRARVALPDFELTEQNAESVVRLCRHLDGIPLALELAAARLRVMDLEQIASQLQDRFRLLTGGDRSAPPRLQTMHNSIDWSYTLLSEAEKTLFRRLAVFAGGWTLPAAKAVCADDSIPEADIFDLLAGLVDKSMVLVVRKKGREIRYRLLETVRQYAHEKLSESGETGSLRDRHLDYFLELAGRAESELIGAEQRLWFARLQLELDNFRLALAWSLAGGAAGPQAGLRLAVSLWWFLYMRDYRKEAAEWLEKTLAASTNRDPADLVTRANALARLPWLIYFRSHPEEEALALGRTLGLAGRESVAFALWGMGVDAFFRADYSRAQSLEEQSLELFRQLGNRWGICETLTYLGRIRQAQGDFQRAKVLLEESLGLACQAGDNNEIGFALQSLGQLALVRGDYDLAQTFLEESRAQYSEIDLYGGGWDELGDVALQKGDTLQAASLYMKTLTLYWELGDQLYIAFILNDLAHVAAVCRQPARAARLFGAAEALLESSGETLLPLTRLEYDHFLETLRPQLDEAAWHARWAEGRAMPLKDVVAYALSDQDL